MVCCFIETTLALLRHPDCCISAYSTVTTLFASIILACLFNRLHFISCFQMFNHWNDVTLQFFLQCNIMRTFQKKIMKTTFSYMFTFHQWWGDWRLLFYVVSNINVPYMSTMHIMSLVARSYWFGFSKFQVPNSFLNLDYCPTGGCETKYGWWGETFQSTINWGEGQVWWRDARECEQHQEE